MSMLMSSSTIITAPKSADPYKWIEFPQIKVASSSYSGGRPGSLSALEQDEVLVHWTDDEGAQEGPGAPRVALDQPVEKTGTGGTGDALTPDSPDLG